MARPDGRMPTRGIQNTIPTRVEATSWPLPTGGATSANQSTQITEAQSTNTKLDTLNAKDFATATKQDTGNTSLSSIDTKIDALTTPSDTQPVSASSLPLPTGASTSAKQDIQTTLLQGIAGLVPTAYDSVVITYTDSTKQTIQTVVFKLGVNTVATLTPTFASTTDTWVKT